MNAQLLVQFEEWRQFEHANLLSNGVPDYSLPAMKIKQTQLPALQQRLGALSTRNWPIAQQIDKILLSAEMNGMKFNLEVLQPWTRDPAFYRSLWCEQSDTPAHEGPCHHALIELWTYNFPLLPEAEKQLTASLSTIPPLLEQARENLTSNAKDLWLGGIPTFRNQLNELHELSAKAVSTQHGLQTAITQAIIATQEFIHWLTVKGSNKSGPSGIGREAYTWYQQHVHLVPLTWDQEVCLLKRELARAHASLRLEEHRNRNLPPLKIIDSPEEYDRRTAQSVEKYLAFLRDSRILHMKHYMAPALSEHVGRYFPEATRHFFAVARQHEPMALWCHWYHWFELAHMQAEPHQSPIRRGALLYNIFDNRSEGLATAMEEMMMHAGLYDDNPRSREVVWILLAQRAARGLASLYLHANEFSLEQAMDFQVANTPRGWMRKDLPLLQFEQHLYLRQPGYGSSYITGKIQFEQLLSDYAGQRGDTFQLADFFADVNSAGIIPFALVRWELTGLNDDVQMSLAQLTGE
jgi:hypothetical protein